jgi:hypothetical protein
MGSVMDCDANAAVDETSALQARLSGPEALAESQASAISAYATEHGVSAERAEAVLDLQTKADNLQHDMRSALGVSFAQVWFDASNSQTNQVVVDVGPGADTALAESVLKEHSIGPGQSRIVQKSWNEAGLKAAVSRLDEQLQPQIRAGLVRVGIAADANAQISVAASASDADRQAIDAVASSADEAVKPTTIDVSTSMFSATPAAYVSPGYGGPPLIAGMYYDVQIWECTVGFYAKSPVSSETYFMTAGHCTGSGHGARACTSSTNCPNFGTDVGGWVGPGGDYGLTIDTRASTTWPPYPAFIDWSCCGGTLPVYGATSPTIGETVCHTGFNSAAHGKFTTCGTVKALNVEIEYEGGAKPVLDELGGANLCVYEGDSGGPVFDPSNAYAKGITDAAEIAKGHEGECGKAAFSMDAALAASDMGVTIAHL